MKADKSYENLAESFKIVFDDINHLVHNPKIDI